MINMKFIKKIIPKLIIISLVVLVVILISNNNDESYALPNNGIITNEYIAEITLPYGTVVKRSANPNQEYESQIWGSINNKFLLGSSTKYVAGTVGGNNNSILPAHNHGFRGIEVTSSTNGAHTHSAGLFGGTQSKKTSTSSKTKLISGSTTKASTSTGAHTHTLTPEGTVSTDGEVEDGTGRNMPPYKTYNMYKRLSSSLYAVSVTAVNGTIVGNTQKTVNGDGTATFTVTASSGYELPATAICSNGNEPPIENDGSFTTGSITSNTTCTVTAVEVPAADFLISKVGQSGLTKITHEADNTLQIGATSALEEYRYIGPDSTVTNNYVTFNNETWRIIGVFPTDDGTGKIENRIKLIKSTSIGDQYWNSNGANNWINATLNTYLNGTFYNSLSAESKNLIGNAKYYLGGYNSFPSISKDVMYTYERKTNGSDYYYGSNPTNWTGKIGLMYASDYGYGASSECTQNLNSYNNSTCYTNDWLYLGRYEWLLPQNASNSHAAMSVSSGGHVFTDNGDFGVGDHQDGVRPVLYLISAAEITGGDGTSGNPYTFG